MIAGYAAYVENEKKHEKELEQKKWRDDVNATLKYIKENGDENRTRLSNTASEIEPNGTVHCDIKMQ